MATRFIPGSAGNAYLGITKYQWITVYPRLCGERSKSDFHGPLSCGLSPALRGTLLPQAQVDACPRFIPGSAGNACFPRGLGFLLPVYPRLCGERYLVRISFCTSAGLSPALRGTHPRLQWYGSLLRFIPGSAGNALKVHD